jgi:hypothetical protein
MAYDSSLAITATDYSGALGFDLLLHTGDGRPGQATIDLERLLIRHFPDAGSRTLMMPRVAA